MYQAEFNEMYLLGRFGPTGSLPTSDNRLTIDGVPVEIYFSPDDSVLERINSAIRSARRSIRFMAFSFTEDELGAMMRQRAAEGVIVQGIFETRASETQYSEMPAMFCEGLEVRQDGNPGTFHHKVVIIDDFVVITGSMNFSDNAADSNDENVIAIADPAIGRLYREEFIRRWGEATLPDIACAE